MVTEGKKIKVVGVDPALRNFGLVNAEIDIDTLEVKVQDMHLAKSENGIKKTKTVRKNSDDLERARVLTAALKEACEGAAFAFVEVPVGSQSARAMASYGICIGVLSGCPIPMIQVTPTEVKLAGTGIKTATKDEMIEAAVALHPDAPWLTRKLKGKDEMIADNEHLADACFAIKAGMATDQFKSILQTLKMLH